jgi:hypothetical protein
MPMALFGPPKNEDYPRKWKDMSLDFKLMFVYHGCMMFLFITGGAFTTRQELFIATSLVVVLTVLSLRHRSAIGWKWEGIKTKDLALALGIGALLAFFLQAATPQFPALNPRFLPWYLAGLGIGAFNILRTLKLVRSSKAQMLADCSDTPSEPKLEPKTEPSEPRWHRVARGIFGCLFLLVWLEGVAFFYYHGKVFSGGSPTPTATQTDPISDHGNAVYVTHNQKVQLDRMETMMFTSIPAILVSGFLLHFLVGVKLFPNTPTLAEWRVGRSLNN